MHTGKRKLKRSNALLYIVNTLVGIVYISPLVWMVSSSFKPENRIFSDMSRGLQAFLPTDFMLENYKTVFTRTDMPRYILNSLFYITILTFLSLLVNSMFGYALAKLRFRGRNFLVMLVLALLVLPLESIILALFFIVTRMGWTDSYLALIVPFIVKCFDVHLFRQFFLDVPNELLEAASIDGASAQRTFFRVVVPISKPVFCTVLILDFIAYWSDFMWPLLVTTSASMRTVQLGLQAFFSEPPVYYGPVMAALVISSLPVLVIFLFLQKYYVQGITAGGIKG